MPRLNHGTLLENLVVLEVSCGDGAFPSRTEPKMEGGRELGSRRHGSGDILQGCEPAPCSMDPTSLKKVGATRRLSRIIHE
jgi:hypothetical protein